jgi:aspartyl-tRNA(Asn)/glutamyl-tRNA(Gln) amidotransferase subunit A
LAADLCIAAIGTDTAGSVRQPAALCGVVGMKPTYGRVSRYGVMPMANSLDQVGVFAKTIEDTAILLDVISGYDEKDAQSVQRDTNEFKDIDFNDFDIKNMRIALPKEFISEGLSAEIKKQLLSIVDLLREHGAVVEEVNLPTLNYVLPIYYTLMPAELSTNLSRFDGIRFGLQKNTLESNSIQDYYQKVRTEGF